MTNRCRAKGYEVTGKEKAAVFDGGFLYREPHRSIAGGPYQTQSYCNFT